LDGDVLAWRRPRSVFSRYYKNIYCAQLYIYLTHTSIHRREEIQNRTGHGDEPRTTDGEGGVVGEGRKRRIVYYTSAPPETNPRPRVE